MSKITVDKGVNIFGALKLIEQLYLDGCIPEYLYRNIIREYSDEIDITAFVYHRREEIE